jgi:poly(hydroxyalkanoate) granule-associated protein
MIRRAKEVQADVTGSAYKLWLASLGVMALAQETGGRVFSDLVKRGREIESQVRIKPPDVQARLRGATDRAKDAVHDLGRSMDQQVTSALHRIGVPTRDEVATLGRRVELLTASIEKLKPKGRPVGKASARN